MQKVKEREANQRRNSTESKFCLAGLLGLVVKDAPADAGDMEFNPLVQEDSTRCRAAKPSY